jgi:hypothetical protein
MPPAWGKSKNHVIVGCLILLSVSHHSFCQILSDKTALSRKGKNRPGKFKAAIHGKRKETRSPPVSTGTMQLKSESAARVAATPRRRECRQHLVAGANPKPNSGPGCSRDEGVTPTFCDGASQPPAAATA